MPTTVPLIVDPKVPQVLLFGHIGAGKSALLGALIKAAETEGPTLRGEVLESSGRLASIRDAVYRGTDLEPTTTELTSYTVRLRPWREGARAVTDPVTVVLNDCSGKAAESLIKHPDSLRDPYTKASVARAVMDADAIVLMVNASADEETLREAFEEFDTFLTIVKQGKTTAREVGGFPILLVLTRCDELARPGDTRATWEARVERRVTKAEDEFNKFFRIAEEEDGIPSPFLPFGSIELTVYAVAVRLPRLFDSPAQPATPYKVADLFRDCFEVAKGHHDRVTASDRRLRWTVRFVLGFLTFLFLGVITVAVFQPNRADPGLGERVAGYAKHEGSAVERLTYPQLGRNKQTLTTFRDDPRYISLPEDLRGFVTSRLKEIDDYEAYRMKLLESIAPGDTRTLDDLAKVEARLHGELGLPAKYGWGETLAAQLRDKWLADVKAIRTAEERFGEGGLEPDPKDATKFVSREGYYRGLVRRGIALTIKPALGGPWRADVNSLLVDGARTPAPLGDLLPGSPALTQPRGQALTYRVPFEFERVYQSRRDWEQTRDRLTHLRDLADALDLTSGPDRPQAVLVLPEPGPGVDSAKLPAQRLAALLRTFPNESADFNEWELRNFPDTTTLKEHLDQSFKTGARHVQSLLRAKIGPDAAQKDNPDGWRAVAELLGDPAFADWGKFLHLFVRLRDSAAPDPVRELAKFLREPSFEFDLGKFEMVIPDVGLERIAPAGLLTITVTPRGGTPVTRTFKRSGDGTATSYRFTAEGDGKLKYHPGDELTAELPVRAGVQEFKLVWEATATKTYQFDKLSHEPRLVKAGGVSEPATGVKIVPSTPAALPRLPALFPDLRK